MNCPECKEVVLVKLCDRMKANQPVVEAEIYICPRCEQIYELDGTHLHKANVDFFTE